MYCVYWFIIYIDIPVHCLYSLLHAYNQMNKQTATSNQMANIKINNTDYEIPDNLTIIEACDLLGLEVPRFCYHPKLKIAGNCRMCLVEVEGVPKPVASCTHKIHDGISIHTNNHVVRAAREGVMEFLLINHPLDCPICDQGGECDLQDQSMKYGRGYSQYMQEKRAVKDKDMGPLIKTHMNRCIHCTRCIRFIEDIAGTHELGAFGRGEDMEVSNYIKGSIESELSGNIIDLCPVGALTSKPYAYKARSWELAQHRSIDVMDAVGCNIRIDTKNNEVMRILPAENDDINEEWISDKARFSYDGLKYQRIDQPLVRRNGHLHSAEWKTAYKKIATVFHNTPIERITVLAGQLTDVETMFLFKKIVDHFSNSNQYGKYDCRDMNSALPSSHRSLYTFNTSIKSIQDADACLIIGSNPRLEAAVLNIQIRKIAANNKPIWLLGEKYDLNYQYHYLGDDISVLDDIANGDHPCFHSLKQAKNPMIIVGDMVFTREDSNAIMEYLYFIANNIGAVREDWNGLNVLSRHACQVGGLDVGFVLRDGQRLTSDIITQSKVIIALNHDTLANYEALHEDTFVIYIGHHGSECCERADIILPSAAYSEKDATYVNTEGRVQSTVQAVVPPGEAKIDWVIAQELGLALGCDFYYDSLSQLRDDIAKQHPLPFASMHHVSSYEEKYADMVDHNIIAKYLSIGKPGVGELSQQKLLFDTPNFYSSNIIAKHSPTMAKCLLNKKGK